MRRSFKINVVVLCVLCCVVICSCTKKQSVSESATKKSKQAVTEVATEKETEKATEEETTEVSTEVSTEASTEVSTEASTEAPSVVEVVTEPQIIEPPTAAQVEVQDGAHPMGVLVDFFGNRPDNYPVNAIGYSNEPYNKPVKEGFRPLNQIYRAPSAEKFNNDGFYDNTLFIGDSITTGIEIYNVSYGYNISAKVFADKGWRIWRITENMDRIVESNPSRIFILLGSNDLNSTAPNIEGLARSYVEQIGNLQSRLPNTKIYITLTLPINWRYEEKAAIRNNRITEFDNRLVELCNENGIYYIDMATSLKDENGVLYDELTEDGLHLKGKYYGYWYNMIEDVIKANEGGN